MRTLNKIGLLCGLIGFFAFAAPLSASDQFDDEWKIGVSGNAVTAGSISFTLTFEPDNNGSARDPITINIPVPANTSEEDIVSLLGDSFSSALGADGFDVAVSWGEHVKVEAEGDLPEFAIALTSNTVQNVNIEIED